MGVSTSLEVLDLVGDMGGFDTMAAALEVLFSQEELGIYLIELHIELVFDVVEVSVSLNFSNVAPVVEFGNGEAEGVEGRYWAIEEKEEPGGHGLDWSIKIIRGVSVELCNVWYLIMVLPGK